MIGWKQSLSLAGAVVFFCTAATLGSLARAQGFQGEGKKDKVVLVSQTPVYDHRPGKSGIVGYMLRYSDGSTAFEAIGTGGSDPDISPKASLRANIDKQRQVLDQKSEDLKNYQTWFSDRKEELNDLKAVLEKEKAKATKLSNSWNTKVNPSCSHGLTYAECDCAKGRATKNAKRAEIDNQKFAESRARKNFNSAVDYYKAKVKVYDRLRNEYQKGADDYSAAVKAWKALK
jgi:hypothetical protein